MNRRSQYAKQKTAITFSYDTVVKQKLLHWTIFPVDEVNTSENELCQS